jgi:pimeloyl-ACP methyl ester carboxylesterase
MTGYGRHSGVGAHGDGYRAVGATSTIMTRSVEGMRVVSEGRLAGGLPCLRPGQGPPLVMAVGGAAEHANPAGIERRVSVSTAARFAGHFTVYVTSRKPGLAAGATMADIAADYAKAIMDDIGEPVAFYGTSAGGAVALQLAIGFPLVCAFAPDRQLPIEAAPNGGSARGYQGLSAPLAIPAATEQAGGKPYFYAPPALA